MDDYFFRIRPYGAAVFKIIHENRHLRTEMTEIADLDLKSGAAQAKPGVQLSADDLAAMQEWCDARRSEVYTRRAHDAVQLIEQLNAAADWVRYDADYPQIAPLNVRLLLAMNDLREALVKRMADHLLDSAEG